ncbi:MAG TPA: hypothetical protein VMX14_13215 [Anaerolineae bacterium]|nr:hypothetical protein [Anaerolineae bacterium]
MQVKRSKSGLPTLTECGGGATSTGSAQIIAGTDGRPVKPQFIPRGYSNGDHATFVIEPGMHVVEASHDRHGERATVHRIARINGDEAVLETVAEYENGDGNVPPSLQDAVDAAIAKAHHYHCRDVHFAA